MELVFDEVRTWENSKGATLLSGRRHNADENFVDNGEKFRIRFVPSFPIGPSKCFISFTVLRSRWTLKIKVNVNLPVEWPKGVYIGGRLIFKSDAAKFFRSPASCLAGKLLIDPSPKLQSHSRTFHLRFFLRNSTLPRCIYPGSSQWRVLAVRENSRYHLRLVLEK